MIIQADQEGLNAIATVCRIALRAADLQALPHVNMVLGNLKPIVEEKEAKIIKIHPTDPSGPAIVENVTIEGADEIEVSN